MDGFESSDAQIAVPDPWVASRAPGRVCGTIVRAVGSREEKVDNGKILGQAVVEISHTDNALSVSKKVLKREHELYPIVLKRFLKGKTNFIKI